MKKNLLQCFSMGLLFFLARSACSFAQPVANKTTDKQVTGVPYFSDPSLSPDGSEIAFVSGGDIWTVPSKGGEARLLVSHPEYESRPLYSPDGRYLAFNSTRSGNGDIYVLNFETGECRRLTYDDGNDEISAWSADGKYIYFSSTSRDISAMRDVFRVKVSGGTPMPVSNNRYMNEFFAMPSADGKTLAFTARGVASHQWWRNGRSHLDESEIWLMHDGKQPAYERVTEGGAKELWPMWSKDGASLYYVSDKSGTPNLWMQPLKGVPRQLTKFTSGRVVWPSIAYNGESIVFERDFKIWKYTVSSGEAAPVAIHRRGSPAGAGVEHLKLVSQFRELMQSPDGKKIAFVAHGEVFVASAKDGGDATRVTFTGSSQSQLSWSPNSNTLVYLSDRDRVLHIYQYNFVTGKESQLTNNSLDDAAPKFSPDAKSLAFVRNGQELHTLDLASKKETMVAKGYFGRPPFASAGSVCWSPDSKWLAYAGFGAKSFRNVSVVPATGGEGRPVSFLANAFGGDVNWSPDGKYILFGTGQRTENRYVARIDLVLQRPKFREEQFQQMFVEQNTSPSAPVTITAPKPNNDSAKRVTDTLLSTAAKPAKPGTEPVVINTDGIRQRLNFLPLGVDVNDQKVSRDGNNLLVVASVGEQQNIYTYSLDELAKEPAVLKQVTFTPGIKSSAQFSADGKEIIYLEQGRIQSVALETRLPKPIAVTAEMDVDFNKEKVEVFYEAWEAQNKGFYDPTFHGKNWKAVRDQYEPLAYGASTPDELRRILSLMVGELNSSHSGISGPPNPASFTTGRIGLAFSPAEYENGGKFKITEITALGATALSGNIHPGDYLTAIDDKVLLADDNIDRLLENKINRRVSLTVSASAAGNDPRKITVRPVNQATEKGLLYKQWVQQQRDYITRISNGRLGYVHMNDMSQQSLDQLYIDMDAENHSREGVVVDIRNNNGGFVNAYALDVIARKGYMTMTSRGLPSAPARTQLGQRALDAPSILVTNQHSLSDAEDFTEGYRTLGLGKVVGEPTGGWIIYTSSVNLIDGSSVRLPFTKVTDHEGKNMEGNPRPVDIAVSRPLGEGNSKDSQLDAAVKELLKELDTAKNAKKGLAGVSTHE